MALLVGGLLLVAFVGKQSEESTARPAPPPPISSDEYQLSFALRISQQEPPFPDAPGEIVDRTRIRPIDGDTFALSEERIRIENIDTPETGAHADCEREALLANDAASEASLALMMAKEIRVHRTGEDRYGRTLARVALNGQDFGEAMIAEAYAVEWSGRQHDWCQGEERFLTLDER